MPLNDGAINQILSFAHEGSESAGDIFSLAEYQVSDLRRRGHQPGIAERGVANRTWRQAAHVCAGLAQFVANRYAPGVLDDGDLDKVEQGLLEVITALIEEAIPSYEKYDLAEFYYFRHPSLKPGFQPAQGGLVQNAATLYPDIWAYLQTSSGQVLCKSEPEWQAMTTAIWHTNADGTTVGWDGIGGAPFYVQDLGAGTLRLPDIRGMYAEAAGFDSLGVGAVDGDRMRQMEGINPLSGADYSMQTRRK
ncbi:MAG: hypothetical protein LBC94_00310 [Desulfovibrio sp.]|jgi:hypothetical protein|nr:hypothetical protein [Desulfovibrio sp.]